MNKNLKKKIAGGLTIGCLILSLGTFAAAHNKQDFPMPIPDNAMHADIPNPAAIEQNISNRLNKLVDDNIISKDQCAKIINFFKQKDSERRADTEKMKTMNHEERHAYLQQKCSNPPDFITELKSAAGLSEEQATAVADALRPPHKPRNMMQNISNRLTKLVDDNIISKDQCAKIINFFKQKDSERRADTEKMKTMNHEERHAYLQQKCSNPPDFITELKSAAGLSEEQATAVADALRPPYKPNFENSDFPMMPHP